MNQKRKKIAYLITHMGTGGAEVVLRDLVLGMNDDLHEVVVISLGGMTDILQQIASKNIRVYNLDSLSITRLYKMSKVITILHKESPDILHTHLFHADMVGRFVGVLLRIPVISTIHNIRIKNKLRTWLLKITRGLVGWYIAVGKMVQDFAHLSGIVQPNTVSVIYNGINHEWFVPGDRQRSRELLGIAQDVVMLVSIGSLTKQKGYDNLIDAFHLLDPKKPYVLIILGEGGERRFLEEKIKKLGITNIILKGNVSDVLPYLHAADMFVMPSLWEGFSIALLETAATSLPIIATDVGGNSELVVHKESGILVPANDVSAMTAAIIQLTQASPETREQMGIRAREIVLNSFTIQKMIQDHKELYEKFLTEYKK